MPYTKKYLLERELFYNQFPPGFFLNNDISTTKEKEAIKKMREKEDLKRRKEGQKNIREALALNRPKGGKNYIKKYWM